MTASGAYWSSHNPGISRALVEQAERSTAAADQRWQDVLWKHRPWDSGQWLPYGRCLGCTAHFSSADDDVAEDERYARWLAHVAAIVREQSPRRPVEPPDYQPPRPNACPYWRQIDNAWLHLGPPQERCPLCAVFSTTP